MTEVLPLCPNDDRPIHDGAWLCDRCGTTLRTALERIIDLRPELEATLVRTSRTRQGGTRREVSRPGDETAIPNETPVPFNLGASRAADVVDSAVTTWARVVMETLDVELAVPLAGEPVTNTWPRCRLVPDHPTARAALLLWRHAEWLRRRPEAEQFYNDIIRAEVEADRVVDTDARESIVIGQCPIKWPDEAAGVERVCGGDVRAWPEEAGLTLVEMASRSRPGRRPQCMKCRTDAGVGWWLEQMRPSLAARVTATELIAVIAYELHWTVTHEQIRQWKHRGKIDAAGRDSRGRTLYEHVAVIDAIRDDVEERKTRRTG